MLTVSVSVFAPPDPLLPRSFVVMVKVAAPLKPSVGVKLMPFKAALMLLIVPWNVIVASAVPSPLHPPQPKFRPLVPLSVNVPLVAVSVTWIAFGPASTSVTEIWLPAPLENVSGVFWLVLCGPGTTFTGASFTALMVIPFVAVLLLLAPSLTMKLTVRAAVGLSLLVENVTERSAVW